jgi:hypothetical protein
LFRRSASALALDTEDVDDGETMVSELAANTLHAQRGWYDGRGRHGEHDRHGDIACGNGRASSVRDIPGSAELWLYLRGSGEQRELVCKVFDAATGWVRAGPGQGGRRAPADSIGGRGLEVVHEMSRGRWGYHLTRARLGGWSLRGKAVWFATPAPQALACPSAASPLLIYPGGPAPAGPSVPASVAMTRLEAELSARGFGETMVRADNPAKDTAVLSVCGELTVWCRAGLSWLRAPGLDGQAWGYGDLVEVAEQAVEAHETLCVDPDLASGQPAAARALRWPPGTLGRPARDP